MLNSKFLLIGPMPPPVTGNSLAFADLVRSFSDRRLSYELLDISPRYKWTKKVGSRNLSRMFDYLMIGPEAIFRISFGRGPVYLTVAQSWTGFIRDMFFIRLARFMRRPIVLHIHGGNYNQFVASLSGWQKSLVADALLSATRIIVLSTRLLHMLDFVPDLKRRLRVVPNGVAMSDHPLEWRAQTKVRPFRVLFLSNLIESKGYLALLRAAGILCQRYGLNSLEFVFAGRIMTNPEDDREVTSIGTAQGLIDSIIAAQGIGGCVSFPGVVSGDAKALLLESSDVLVLPTRYNNEGQPLAILEAMAFGLPVIATEYRAIPDMVVPGKTGIFIPPDDPPRLANAIADLYEDRVTYLNLSRGARQMAHEEFTLKRHLDAMHEILLNVGQR